MKICQFCGAPINDEAVFCPKCGQKAMQPLPGQPNIQNVQPVPEPVFEQPYEQENKPLGFEIKPTNSDGFQLNQNAYQQGSEQENVLVNADHTSFNPDSIPLSQYKPLEEDHNYEEKNKNPGKKKVVITSVILAVILLFIAVSAFLMFPLNVTVDFNNQKHETSIGYIENFKIDVSSNQPVSSVEYAVIPGGSNGDATYTKVKTSGFLFNKTAVIEKLMVPIGNSSLHIKIKTLFGQEEKTFKLNGNIGTVSPPQQEALVHIDDTKDLISNELIIVFKKDISEDEIKKMLKKYDGRIVGSNTILEEYQVRFNGKGEEFIDGIYEKIKKESIVESIYHNYSFIADTSVIPNDSKYDSWNVGSPAGNNWGLEAINAPGAWDNSTKLQTIRAGVIDTCLRYDHEDLQIDSNRVNFFKNSDFKNMKSLIEYIDHNKKYHEGKGHENCTFCSMENHGTHCTGIVGALGNNKRGVSGVAWNAEMYFTPFWHLSKDGDTDLTPAESTNTFLYDITWLAANGCRVISLSIGAAVPTDPGSLDGESEISEYFDNAIKKLEDKGYDFIICKAAGNSNENANTDAMSRYLTAGETAKNHVIIVGAAAGTYSEIERPTDMKANASKIYNLDPAYSNFGDMVDIGAPGTNIYSTVVSDKKYANMSGTSMATPAVAGAATMVYGANPNLTAKKVKEILCKSTKNYCVKNQSVCPMLDVNEAVKWALNNKDKVPEKKTPNNGFVTGVVQDGKTKENISEGIVYAIEENTGICTEASVIDGYYELWLAAGNYTMKFTANGYTEEVIYHVEVKSGLLSYNVLLFLVENKNEKGTIRGSVIDAFDGTHLPNAQIKIYKGVNNTDGNPVTTVTSDATGLYSVELEPGNYTVSATVSGYLPGTATVLSIAGQTNGDQDCAITPILNEGEIRVVLTWGEYPRDLDSHLVGPTPDGGTFHTLFSEKNYFYNGVQYDNLDLDDTTSFGPETTSVYVGVNGTYTFCVHNFSDRASSTSATMSTSGAQVKLYVAGQAKPIVYNVPNKAGTVWKVFSITNGVVTPINQMSFESDPHNVGR